MDSEAQVLYVSNTPLESSMNPFLLIAAMSLGALQGSVAKAKAIDRTLLPYEKPGNLVSLRDRRVLHIKCMGTGTPTIVLTAGLGEWSATWRLVQPALAARYRTCAWDRPGIGFSSGSYRSQTVAVTTTDLAEGLRTARIPGPFVLVGHSLGGFETLLFADRYRSRVVGMVLVDPGIPDQLTRFRRAAPAFEATIEASNAERPALLRKCAVWVSRGGNRSAAPDPGGCLSFPDDYPLALAKSLAQLDLNAARWAANISLSERFADDTQLVVNPKRNYGNMPLIVLTSSKLPAFTASTPQATVRDAPRLLAELNAAHDELAALSTRGVNRSVPDSGHYIQIEHPEAVLAAVEEVASQRPLTSATAP